MKTKQLLTIVMTMAALGAHAHATTFGVGTTKTGKAGTSAKLTLTQTANSVKFNFTIPRGATGPQGPIGPAGVATIADGSITLAKLASNIGVFLANGSDVYWHGNVGIGTSSPTSKLDVNGTVSARALRAPGAGINTGTFALVHSCTTTTGGDSHVTVIDNAVCNGDPNAILIVTHNWSKDTSTNSFKNDNVGVWYNGSKWTIFHEDTAIPMQVGDAFNVMIIKP